MPILIRNRRLGHAAIASGLLALIVTTAMLSWPALSDPFLFDDFPNLENLATLNGNLDWSSLANFSSLYRSQAGRPLSMLSFVINDFDWPSQPWSFKYTNLLIHLLIGVLVFGLSRSLARMRFPTGIQPEIVALLAAGAWLLHPMQLSTSMLVVQRMTQLSALFTFAGLWGYVALSIRAHHLAMAFGAICVLGVGTVLATLSKETGALAPLLAVVINTTLMRAQLKGIPAASRHILRFGTVVPVAALLGVILTQMDFSTAFDHRPFTLGERLLTETRVLSEYAFNIVVPSLRGGGIYHDDFGVSHGLLDPWTTLPATLFVLGVAATAIAGTRRWPIFSFAVLWFICGHLLESTVFPIELYFEHRNYLPMFGILFALATAVVGSTPTWKNPVLALACLWIAFAAWLTSVQAPIWGSKSALVSVWAIEHPNSPRAIQQKAAELFDRGQHEEAADTLLGAYQRGVQGSDFPAQVFLLACLNNDRAMAEHARRLLRDSLTSGDFTYALPLTLRKLRFQAQAGRCPDLMTPEDWLDMSSTLLDSPSYSRGEPAAFLYTERAYFYMGLRDLNSTMTELESAWTANGTPQLAQLIAATLASAGLYDEAEKWVHRALEVSTPGIRGLFAQDELKSLQLLDSLRKAKERQSRRAEPERSTSRGAAKPPTMDRTPGPSTR